MTCGHDRRDVVAGVVGVDGAGDGGGCRGGAKVTFKGWSEGWVGGGGKARRAPVVCAQAEARAIRNQPRVSYVPYQPGDCVFKDGGPSGLPCEGILSAAHVTGIVRGALLVADREGVPRKMVADRLGVSEDTLDSWILPSRRPLVPSWALVLMLSKGGNGVRVAWGIGSEVVVRLGVGGVARVSVLPAAARQYIVDALASMADMVAFEVPGGGEAAAADAAAAEAPEVGVCDITAALGSLAGALHAARDAAGSDGHGITADEAALLMVKVDDVLREAGQLRADLAGRAQAGGVG